jgi:hypothetical protein
MHHYRTNCLEYANRKSKKTEGLQLKGTHQLLVYADHVLFLGENIKIIKQNTWSKGEYSNLRGMK